MTIARSLAGVTNQQNSVVTVGTFDGVHAGHRAIMRELTSRAAASGARSVVITFEPHPRTVVGKGDVEELTSLEERLELFGGLGLDVALVLEFTYEFSRQSPREFWSRYLINGTGVREAVIGYDHMFGRDREAGIRELRGMGNEFGFGVRVVDPVSIDGRIVSSSRIRELLHRGDTLGAAKCLERPYSISGTVVQGDGRGKKIGFPTANLAPDPPRKLIPADGVYFVSADLGHERYYGMLNIGVRPTFVEGGARTVEVHLFDFNGDARGRRITVNVHQRLRGERKFSSADDLIRQLHADRESCMRLIAAAQLLSS